jgi:glycosyltransferase involved in cell wall biosynthesis
MSGFAYLFERYPSFTQTFCVREVLAMRRSGLEFPVYAIRNNSKEPAQHYPEEAVSNVTCLPDKFDDILANDTNFRRAARKWQAELEKMWGYGSAEKHRIYEALWLGPRLGEQGIHHVHVHFAGLAARTAFWLKKIFGIHFSVTAHANDIFRDEPPARLGQVLADAEVVVTVSDFSVRYLREHFPAIAGKFARVYNGIATDSFPRSTFPEGVPLIVGVGRYIEKKGFMYLVEACSRLGSRAFECRIIGCGPDGDALKAKVAELGLDGRVNIAGSKFEEEIREILSQARVFALPCVETADGAADNLPTVIMEAMAAGVPSVSTSLAGVPEMIADGETGYLVPPRDVDQLAARLAEFLDNRELAIRMGAAGRVRCQELFDLEKTAACLQEVLRTHGAFDLAQPARPRFGFFGH